ncbi:MAG: hypothetical protein GX616_15270 [Planctomycetes bacterium]|nr:hypothetical protein [Planctomycetota bacterium]
MIPAAMATALATIAGCAGLGSKHPFDIRPHMNTCEVMLVGPARIGDMRLWVPEGIATDTGFSSIYPVGSAWTRVDGCWVHRVTQAGLFGPGNFTRVATDTLECAGIRVPVDEPVEWTTTLRPTTDGVAFSIRLTNRGTRSIRKAGAAICLKFFKAPWWSDANTFVRSDGHVQSLAALGRDSGMPNGFEAYLMTGESYDNVFYRQFWGFNRHRLDLPLMVSHNTTAGRCIALEAPNAYFLHSNPQNPCTDVMLAFGDVAPETTVERNGEVRIIAGTPAKAFGHD